MSWKIKQIKSIISSILVREVTVMEVTFSYCFGTMVPCSNQTQRNSEMNAIGFLSHPWIIVTVFFISGRGYAFMPKHGNWGHINFCQVLTNRLWKKRLCGRWRSKSQSNAHGFTQRIATIRKKNILCGNRFPWPKLVTKAGSGDHISFEDISLKN